MENIGVSILCLAYNHEQYIADAIEGFLKQKTNFPFEVIINEDASTDGTAQIIREYEQKYPDIIRPIYHKENQYSQCVNINDAYMVPLARGKYIALCDGDDYWTDPLKLQKQYDAMEQNPTCHMCLHNVRELNLLKPDLKTYIPRREIQTGLMSSYAFFTELGKSNFFNEVCYFFRREDYAEYQRNYPDFAQASMKTKTDDAPMLLYFGQLGDVYYINEPLAVYRHFVQGSWSDGFKDADSEKVKAWCDSGYQMYTLFNKFTDNRYALPLARKLKFIAFRRAEANRDYKAMAGEELKEILNSQSANYRMRVRLMAACPQIFGLFFAAYDKLRKRK